MNDREYKAQSKRINAAVARWKRNLGLNNWEIDVQCCREGEMLTNEDRESASSFSPAADCEAHWQYQSAAIRFNTPLVATFDDDELNGAVVHELMHVMVCELRPARFTLSHLMHEERVVTMLTNAALWTREDGRKEGRKAAT